MSTLGNSHEEKTTTLKCCGFVALQPDPNNDVEGCLAFAWADHCNTHVRDHVRFWCFLLHTHDSVYCSCVPCTEINNLSIHNFKLIEGEREAERQTTNDLLKCSELT